MSPDKKDEERENTLAIIKMLSYVRDTLMKDGFPKEPQIIQGDPKDRCCFFLALWKNDDAHRKLDIIEIKTRSIAA